MTATDDTELSLESVKEKFLESQERLSQITESLESVHSATAKVDQASLTLAGGFERLAETTDALKGSTRELATTCRQMTSAVEMLGKLDPRRLLKRLDELAVGANSLQDTADRIETATNEHLPGKLETLGGEFTQATEGLRGKVRGLQALMWVLLSIQVISVIVISVLIAKP